MTGPHGAPSAARFVMARRALRAWLAVVLVAGCSGPILANPPLDLPAPATVSPAPSRSADPIPVVLPRDDGPHDRLTEWWYYTGHLATAAGRRFGFEAVVFRAERSAVPSAWASHLALTDEAGNRFLYAQRSEVGSQADRSPRGASGEPVGFDLRVTGLSPGLVQAGAPRFAEPWVLAGGDGTDRIVAEVAPAEAAAAGASFGLSLDLAASKPATLHDGDGWVDFGAAGSSYYYSRTRMDARGEVRLDGEVLLVEGIAWFDHQWGDFVSVGGGGWDWFAINLEDGTDVTVSIVRDTDLLPILVYGTAVDSGGAVRRLSSDDFTVRALGEWTSPRSGRTYPQAWEVDLGPSLGYRLEIVPTVADQELDTRATTGVVYWEGSNRVSGTGPAGPISGDSYVEITRYGG